MNISQYLSIVTKTPIVEDVPVVPRALWVDTDPTGGSIADAAHLLAVQRGLDGIHVTNVRLDDLDPASLPSVDVVLLNAGPRGIDFRLSRTIDKVFKNFGKPVYAVSTFGDAKSLSMFDHVFAIGTPAHNFDAANVTYGPDVAIALNSTPVKKVDTFGKRIGVALDASMFAMNAHSLLLSTAAFLRNLDNTTAHLLAFSPKDITLNRQLVSVMGDAISRVQCMEERYLQRPEAMIKFISSLDHLVCMHYHAALFAIMTGVPFTVVAPSDPLRDFLTELGLEDRIYDPPLPILTTIDDLALRAVYDSDFTKESRALPEFNFGKLKECIHASKRKTLSYTRAQLMPPRDKALELAATYSDPADVTYSLTRLLGPRADAIAARLAAGTSINSIAGELYGDLWRHSFPVLKCDLKVVVDALYTCSNDDSIAMRALMQFDQAILGKPFGDYLILDPDVNRTEENQALLERHGVLPFQRPWAGIYSGFHAPMLDMAECRALIVPTEACKKALESDLRSQENWGGIVLVVPPVIDLDLPKWSLSSFDRTIVQTVAGRICQLPMDAYKNPKEIRKATLHSIDGLSECDCSRSVACVDSADESLLFVDADDSRELIRMISRLQPGIVFRTRHAEELLGASYPGFFEHLSEAAELAKSADTLLACDQYLKSMDRERFSLQQFARNMQKALQELA